MAKRFTDTEKWKRPWFNKLPIQAKLVWIYVLDNCDYAGIWQADFELLSFQVGFPVTPEDFTKWFGSKAQFFEDKYHFSSFVDFQYGTLKPDNKVHRSVIELIEKLDRPTGLPRGVDRPKDKEQEQEKEKDKDKKKEQEKDKEQERAKIRLIVSDALGGRGIDRLGEGPP